MPGIGIVTNPHSRRNRRYPDRMRRMGYILGQEDAYQMTRSVYDIRRVAEEFQKNEIDILALNGGDGTNHHTLTSFIEVYKDTPLPLIAPLRGGTMNTISNAVGIGGTPGKLLLNIVEKYYTKQEFEIEHRNIIKVDDGRRPQYGFIFGMGFVTAFLDEYYKSSNPSPWVGFTTLARCFGSMLVKGPLIRRVMRRVHVQLELDDGEVWGPEDFMAIGGSTVEQIGLGFRPFVRCQEEYNGFCILAIKASAAELARQLVHFRTGVAPPRDKFLSAATSRVVITSKEPVGYIIDGDTHEPSTKLELSAGPRLRLIIR